MESLISNNWQIANWYGYVISAVFASTGVRFLLSIFSAFHLKHIEGIEFYKGFKYSLCGWVCDERIRLRDRSDYLTVFFLGFLELFAYPILIKTGAFSVIGAWIGLKTIAQWNTWKEQRTTFNRFLIGNALVVILSYYLARYFVVIIPDIDVF